MPLLRSDQIPLPSDDLAALRARLAEPFDFELLQRDERRYLFVRVPADEPDPVVDLERGLEQTPAWLPPTVTDVFLLGTRLDLHVPIHYVRPLLDNLRRLDDALAKRARDELDVHYGVQLRRAPADPPERVRLLVRIPRDRCLDLSEADLSELAQRVGPLHDAGELRGLHLCHLVAETDHHRFRPRDFLPDLIQRWLPLREARRAASPPPAPVVPPASVLTAVVARRVVDVTPVFELEVDADAQTAGPSASVEATPLRERLEGAGYTITEGEAAGPFRLLADRTLAFPHRVGLLYDDRVTPESGQRAQALLREHALDLLLLVSNDIPASSARRLAASRVKLLKPDELAQLRL